MLYGILNTQTKKKNPKIVVDVQLTGKYFAGKTNSSVKKKAKQLQLHKMVTVYKSTGHVC